MTTPRRRPTKSARRSAPLKRPEVEAAQVMKHMSAISLLMGSFHLRHILRLYAAFDGDVLEAVVLGEVAHHNFAALRNAAGNAVELSALTKHFDESGLPPMLPTNAYSIADATGIPRETVRRKIASLVRRQLLDRDQRGGLFVRPSVRERFAEFNVESVAELIETCRQIESLLREGARPGTRGRRG